MTSLQTESLIAVQKINEELEKKYSDPPVLTATIGAEYVFVSISPINLPEFNLFNSVEDNRQYDEDDDKYETIYDLIKRRFKEIKEEVACLEI